MLTAGSYALSYFFEQHVERRIVGELRAHLNQLINNTRFSKTGGIKVAHGAMIPQFSEPYSGLYWQINGANAVLDSSASLWDTELTLPKDKALPEIVEYLVTGPNDRKLLLVHKPISKKNGEKTAFYDYMVAVSHDTITASVDEFSRELWYILAGFGSVIFLLVFLQISYGLRPLRDMLGQVAAVHRGERKRMDADQPVEVAPLVEELNALLSQQEYMMERARARSASLAHGLKTPLAIVLTETVKLASGPGKPVGEAIERQVEIMNRQIERELIRTRIRGATYGTKPSNLVAPLARDVVNSLTRLPGGGDLDWRVEVPEDLEVAVETDDLAEILGNLLDNCRKWAGSTVRVSGTRDDRVALLVFEDDGPGLPSETFGCHPERGLRLDEAKPGTGMGLAIVNDIVVEYGGSLSAGRSDLGGLRLEIALPAGH